MILLIKLVYVMLISLLLSILVGLLLIPFFKKKNIDQRINIYLKEEHKSKEGTPTMGGLIFIIPTIISLILLLILKKIFLNINFFMVILTFLLFAFIGFIDDFLIIKRNSNDGLSAKNKFMLQFIFSIVILIIYLISNNSMNINFFNLELNIGYHFIIVFLLVLVSSCNAVNLTDGIDGLAGSISIIVFISLGIITCFTKTLFGYESIALFCFSIVGSLIGFLLFNLFPAKIFMGDTGSLSLGATMGIISILIGHEMLKILFGIIFVIETTTCIIQKIYYKFTKKRFFLMTPIHHSFEKKRLFRR